MDCSLLSSTDVSYIMHGFDACINLGSRGTDTRVNLRRGWDALLTKGEGVHVCNDETNASASMLVFEPEQLENSIVCDKLAAAMMKKMATWFLTLTMNQKEHFGMRLLKSWLEDPHCVDFTEKEILRSHLDAMGWKLSDEDRDKLHDDMLASSSLLSLRIYENVWHVFQDYFTNSPEKPLGGKVSNIFIPTENQDQMKAGNLPHKHMIVWVEGDDRSDHQTSSPLVENIRGSLMHLVDESEIQSILDEGIASSYEDLVATLERLATFLTHQHSTRCMVPFGGRRAATSTDNNFTAHSTALLHNASQDISDLVARGYRCKVPNNHFLTPDPNKHCFVPLNKPHTEKADEVLRELNMLKTESNPFGDSIKVYESASRVLIHIPPTTADHHAFSPVFQKLALLNPGNSNVQYLNDLEASNYVSKYTVNVDQSNRVFMRVPTATQPSTVSYTAQNLPNTKITSVDMELKGKNQQDSLHAARIIGLPELSSLLYQGCYTANGGTSSL